MDRHTIKTSLSKNIKRGLCIISALILCFGFTVVRAEDSGVAPAANNADIRVSYVNFYSNRVIDPSTGMELVNNQDWIIIDFNLDGYYSGTIDYWCQFNKPVLANPELTAIGAYYTVSSVTGTGSTFVTQKDTFQFTIENCQHFQIIYHLESTGGLSFAGQHALTDSDLTHSGSGESIPGISVDYTSVLDSIADYAENISLDLDSLIDNIGSIITISQNIASTIQSIYSNFVNDLYDIKLINIADSLNKGQRDALFILLKHGGKIVLPHEYDDNQKMLSFPFLVDLSEYNDRYFANATDIYIYGNVDYYFVFYSNLNLTSTRMRLRYSTSNSEYYDIVGVTNYTTKYYEYSIINYPSNRSVSLVFESHPNYVYPIYFGIEEQMNEEVSFLVKNGSESSYNILNKIKELLGINNNQNEEVLQNLEGIQQNQETINQSIQGFNEDFNQALENVPLNSVNEQLLELNNTFTLASSWWTGLWNALGKVTIIFVVMMILIFIRIVMGKSK